jgi:hypothetical protein
MPNFQTTENVEEGLKQAMDSRRDDLGYCYHTFRIRLHDAKTEWQTVLTELVDAGWQLQGAPVVVETADSTPCHLLISMLQATPQPLQIRGEVRIHGEFNGGGEVRGHSIA